MVEQMKFSGKKLLVVGGAGFVGSNLVELLLQHDPAQIVIVDNLLSSDPSNIPIDDRVHFVLGSIAEDSVLDQLPRDLAYVWHLACYHGNQSSIQNPIEDHANNTYTSLKLFDALSRFSGLEKVVYAAAGCAVAEKTFDDPAATPEDAPVSLFHDSPYSISKLVGEFYGNYYYSRHGLPFVKARFQNVYGPREILGAGRWRGTVHTVWRNVTPTFVWKALHKEALGLDNGGHTSRDFIFVEDLVRGLMLCAAKGDAGEVYNLASGKETTILHLAEMVNEITGNTTEMVIQPVRDWDRSGRRFGATEKSEAHLSFRAGTEMREGLRQTIEWTKNNQDRIQACIDQHSYFMAKHA